MGRICFALVVAPNIYAYLAGRNGINYAHLMLGVWPLIQALYPKEEIVLIRDSRQVQALKVCGSFTDDGSISTVTYSQWDDTFKSVMGDISSRDYYDTIEKSVRDHAKQSTDTLVFMNEASLVDMLRKRDRELKKGEVLRLLNDCILQESDLTSRLYLERLQDQYLKKQAASTPVGAIPLGCRLVSNQIVHVLKTVFQRHPEAWRSLKACESESTDFFSSDDIALLYELENGSQSAMSSGLTPYARSMSLNNLSLLNSRALLLSPSKKSRTVNYDPLSAHSFKNEYDTGEEAQRLPKFTTTPEDASSMEAILSAAAGTGGQLGSGGGAFGPK